MESCFTKKKMLLWILIFVLSFIGGLVVFNRYKLLGYFYLWTKSECGIYDYSTYFWLDPKALNIEDTIVQQVLSGIVRNIVISDGVLLTVEEGPDSEEIKISPEVRVYLRECDVDCEGIEPQLVDYQQIRVGDNVQLIIEKTYDRDTHKFKETFNEIRVYRYSYQSMQ